MAKVLQSVISGDISLEHLFQWLSDESVQNPNQLISEDKSQFIPYFLNYLRDNCSWLYSNTQTVNATERVVDKANTVVQEQKLNNRNNDESIQNSIATEKRMSKSRSPFENNVSKVECLKVNSITQRKDKFRRNVINLENSDYNNPAFNKYEEPIENFEGYCKRMSGDFIKKEQKTQAIIMGCASYTTKRHGRNNKQQFKPRCSVLRNKNDFMPDINNFDHFPPVGSNITPKSHRRINPTPVQPFSKETSVFSSTPFSAPSDKVLNSVFQISPIQDGQDFSLKQEREMLKKTKNNLVKNVSLDTKQNTLKIDKITTAIQESVNARVEPDPSLVHTIQKLTIFVEIYNKLIILGLVPNITSELHFMFQLITSTVKVGEESNSDAVFSTVHNCIYFAVSVLNKQSHLLTFLGRNTLIALLEIPFLHKFSEELTEFLRGLCNKKGLTRKVRPLPPLGVSFQADTDSRQNFPTDNSFHTFRKQRDFFYELLREWQQNCIVTDVRIQEKFDQKVKHMLSIGSDSANYFHLARLIQSQLVASCLGSVNMDQPHNELLKNLKGNFPGRFEKLQERFSVPSRAGGSCPPPTFEGPQAFYFDLLKIASSAPLNQHMLNILASEILKLNSCDFTYLESESTAIEETYEKFSSALNTLRLLAKFFGYLTFMPYKSNGSLPSSLFDFQKSLRKNVSPLLNVGSILQEAMAQRKLILTVPWIVEYLSMMDPVAPSLEYNVDIFQTLVEIYRGKNAQSMHHTNFLFVRLVIGWLFENPIFPQEFLYMAYHCGCKESKTSNEGLDFLNVVDKEIVYSCCPYLSELKGLLDDYVNGIKSKTREVRKITPFSTNLANSTTIAKQQILHQLEENFFFVNPPSLKKVVEFVAERITSKIIQKIRSEVNVLKLEAVQNILQLPSFELIRNDLKQNIFKLKLVVNIETLKLCEEARKRTLSLTHKLCYSEIEKVLPLLLPEETKEIVLKTCCQISTRFAINKITEWSDSNIIPDNIRGDIKNKVEQTVKTSNLPQVFSGNDNTQYSVIGRNKRIDAKFLNFLRGIVNKIISKEESCLSEEILLQVFDDVIFMVNEKQDVRGTIEIAISLIVDVIIALLVHLPVFFTNQLFVSFVFMLKKCPQYSFNARDFMCPRNIHFLQKSDDPDLSFTKFACLLDFMVKSDLVTPEQLDLYVGGLVNCKWTKPEVYNKFISSITAVSGIETEVV